ncbi:hypothetical protein M422DRAFT_158487 [Sphaerobolus stellatus SS14]|nr:hypothetical protein M422DRAFT_158487 [Sphaerobolus stellatus SS14]
MVDIYSANNYNDYWRMTSSRRKRPLSSIILEPEIKDMILDDAKDFLENEKWYLDRGIPYRRGYLLYGVPGSGKTSLIHSLAGELNLDVYVISLAKKGLDDSDLSNLMAELPKRCIALMEDIDVAFKGSGKRLGIAGSDKDEAEPSNGVTLSGLLNALDGITAQEGRILFTTTNRLAALDDALCRPGRMDVHVEFKNASKWQAKMLFGCFFPPTSKLVESEDDKKYAEEFAEIIPDRMVSVAALQGLLLCHKNKPWDAIDATKVWVKGQLEKRAEVAKEEKKRKEEVKGQKTSTASENNKDEDEDKGKRKKRRRRRNK